MFTEWLLPTDITEVHVPLDHSVADLSSIISLDLSLSHKNHFFFKYFHLFPLLQYSLLDDIH